MPTGPFDIQVPEKFVTEVENALYLNSTFDWDLLPDPPVVKYGRPPDGAYGFYYNDTNIVQVMRWQSRINRKWALSHETAHVVDIQLFTDPDRQAIMDAYGAPEGTVWGEGKYYKRYSEVWTEAFQKLYAPTLYIDRGFTDPTQEVLDVVTGIVDAL